MRRGQADGGESGALERKGGSEGGRRRGSHLKDRQQRVTEDKAIGPGSPDSKVY